MHHSWAPRSGAVPCVGAALASAHTWSRDLRDDPSVSSRLYPEAVTCKTETLLRSGSRSPFVYVPALTIGKERKQQK